MTCLTQFAEKSKIMNAAFVGIGAVDKAELAHYRVDTKVYSSHIFSEPLEISQLTGNIFLFENKPLVHAHITLGDVRFHTYSGHLKKAIVSAACEITLWTLDTQLSKEMNPQIGLTLLPS